MEPKVIAPNGLPIVSFRADGTQLENPHADHPTYRYPVRINFVGPVTEHHRNDFRGSTGREPTSDQDIRDYFQEEHALVFIDDRVALTMYEYEYFLWGLKKGKYLGRSGGRPDMQLDPTPVTNR